MDCYHACERARVWSQQSTISCEMLGREPNSHVQLFSLKAILGQ